MPTSHYYQERLKRLMKDKEKHEEAISYHKIAIRSINKELKKCREYCNNPPLQTNKKRKEYYDSYEWE